MAIFEQYWIWMLSGFLVARIFYRARIKWLKKKVSELDHELIKAGEREDELRVKAGTHQLDWDINDWVEDGDVWDGISQKDRNEV